MTAVNDPNEAANQLVRENLELVTHLVQQLAAGYPRHVDRSELWSAGMLGLVEASRRFDPSMGIPFARYAAIRVRGAIIDSTRGRDWASRRVRRRLREVDAAESAFVGTEGRHPEDAELARMVGCTPEELHTLRARADAANVLTLDWDVDDDGTPLTDRVEETEADCLPEEALERRELVGTLRTAVEHLPPVQREVIERYYLEGERLQDIASELGVTEARTSQIRGEGVNAIRAYLSQLYEGVPEVPSGAAGRQQRAEYVAAVSAQSTWRSRLEAGSVLQELSA